MHSIRAERSTIDPVSLALLALAVGCGSGRSQVRSTVVTSTGRIGPLHIDRSTRAAVIAFAGRPDAERHARETAHAPYDALGYDCGKTIAAGAYPEPDGPRCRTFFFIHVGTGTLENFFTTEARYNEGHGVRIGMATAAADRLLHMRLRVGCDTSLYLSSPTATMSVVLTGGVWNRKSLLVTGGHVYAFVLHSKHRDAGVFDCW